MIPGSKTRPEEVRAHLAAAIDVVRFMAVHDKRDVADLGILLVDALEELGEVEASFA